MHHDSGCSQQVNPATSYEQSMWPTIGPLLPRVSQVCVRQSILGHGTGRCEWSCSRHPSELDVHGGADRRCRCGSFGKLILPRPQDVYGAVPIALAPVLGNPLALAAAGVDRSLPIQQQVLQNCMEATPMHIHHRAGSCSQCSSASACVGDMVQPWQPAAPSVSRCPDCCRLERLHRAWQR